MNIWSEILSPALLALLYTTLFAIPAWALFRWLLQKEWLGLLERSIRLFIILITVIINVALFPIDTPGIGAHWD